MQPNGAALEIIHAQCKQSSVSTWPSTCAHRTVHVKKSQESAHTNLEATFGHLCLLHSHMNKVEKSTQSE